MLDLEESLALDDRGGPRRRPTQLPHVALIIEALRPIIHLLIPESTTKLIRVSSFHMLVKRKLLLLICLLFSSVVGPLRMRYFHRQVASI